jgi:hypothetical protein
MPTSRHLRTCCLLIALLGAAACGSDPEPVTIDRATFVDTYVALRTAALQRGNAAVDGPLRDTVLRESGVSEEQLVTFAEVHGADFDFMRGVWTEVSARLDSISFRPPGPDAADGR